MFLVSPGQLVKITNKDRKDYFGKIGIICSYHMLVDIPPKIIFVYKILIDRRLVKDTFNEDEFEVI